MEASTVVTLVIGVAMTIIALITLVTKLIELGQK